MLATSYIVLNSRLAKLETDNNISSDKQNGFRKGCSTVDHILSLSTIIETGKLHKKSTFVAFIDFKKAYDSKDRGILFAKLNKCRFKWSHI